MTIMIPTIKTSFFCGIFALLGVWTVFFRAPLTPELLPHVLFYTVLVINTFFSVQFYAAIQPKNVSQTLIDITLAVCYIALALSLGQPLPFALWALALFVAAPPKYALMLGLIPHTALLWRKIRIDLTGTAACAGLLAATLLGYPLLGAWVFAILFALANVYLLAIKPMYRL